ncbi:MAG: GGDEF domain-containing protein [Eubacteriales bacterium]
MAYGSISLERRLKENSKNYAISNLLDLNQVKEEIEALQKLCNVGFLLTDRHGEALITCGDFSDFVVNVEENPGINLRVVDRTMAHVYLQLDYVELEHQTVVLQFIDAMIKMLANLATKTFYQIETAMYADELDEKVLKEKHQVEHGQKEDALTGVLNRLYFGKRRKVIDRAKLAPVTAICVNINDWKFFNENFGDEVSDQLIKIVADILKTEAKPEYIIGRVDGDVFNIIIPAPEDDEAEDFCKRIKEACQTYEDDKIAPSIAVGMVVKENVEEKLSDTFSDAEYEMFQDKFEIKNSRGYRERLEKGLIK